MGSMPLIALLGLGLLLASRKTAAQAPQASTVPTPKPVAVPSARPRVIEAPKPRVIQMPVQEITASPPAMTDAQEAAALAERRRASGAAGPTLAQQVANDIRAKGRGYTRSLLVKFQKSAGLLPDGKYGNKSAAALKAAGVQQPPRALYASRKR